MMQITTRMLTVALVGTVLLGLAGCTPTDSPVTPTSSTVTELPREGIGLADSVTITSSTHEPGTEATAEGVVVVPADADGTVYVSVSWVNSRTATVYARTITELKRVTGGSEHRWKVRGAVPADATDVDVVVGATLVQS